MQERVKTIEDKLRKRSDDLEVGQDKIAFSEDNLSNAIIADLGGSDNREIEKMMSFQWEGKE